MKVQISFNSFQVIVVFEKILICLICYVNDDIIVMKKAIDSKVSVKKKELS